MMDLESLLKMWETDSKIDDVNLDDTSINSAKLHSKYLELYSHAKLRLKKKELELAVLNKDLWLYYNGKMTKEEMDALSWNYDPFNGMAKPLKGDMNKFYDADPNKVEMEMRVEYLKTYCDTCKDIIDNVRFRHLTIKNIIAHRQFVSGN